MQGGVARDQDVVEREGGGGVKIIEGKGSRFAELIRKANSCEQAAVNVAAGGCEPGHTDMVHVWLGHERALRDMAKELTIDEGSKRA